MSDDYAEYLISEARQPAVGLITFYQTPITEDTVVLFVEGEDDDAAFYSSYVSEFLSADDLAIIGCGNKAGVIGAAEELESHVKEYKVKAVLYFVDRDFDDYLGLSVPEAVFRTNYYSIESYLLDRKFLDSVLRKHCGCRRKRERSKYVTSLTNALDQAASHFIPVSGLMCQVRANNISIDFDSIPIVRLARIQNGDKIDITLNPWHDILAHFSAEDLPEDERKAFEGRMRADDYRKWIRGRHGWQILKKICEALFAGDLVVRKMTGFLSRDGLCEAHSAGVQVAGLSDYVVRRRLPQRGHA